jgi:putative transposase
VKKNLVEVPLKTNKSFNFMKSGVFSRIYIHLVFSPKNREALLIKDIRVQLFPYLGKTIYNLGSKPLIINGTSDHLHLLIALNPKNSISDLVRDLKRCSSLWINEHNWFRGKFLWQDGYGVFSCGQRELDAVFRYIQHQEEHHKKTSFREEYIELLRQFQIEFNEQFLFEFFRY